jgi:hypothetical protein
VRCIPGGVLAADRGAVVAAKGGRDNGQRQALCATGCGVTRAENASDGRRDGRTDLQVLLDFVRPADTLVVPRTDLTRHEASMLIQRRLAPAVHLASRQETHSR